MFNQGDQVYYRDYRGTVTALTVVQAGDNTTRVRYASQEREMPTDQLWAQEPVWAPGHLCECGCPLADHCGPRGGCASHQAHAFVAA